MTRPPLPSTWAIQFVSGMRARAIGKIEVTANRGQLVDYVVERDKGAHGDYYCGHAVAATAADLLGAASPILMSGSCLQQRQRAHTAGALRTRLEFDAARAANPLAVAGWIFLAIDMTAPGDGPALPGHAHHTGVVGDIAAATGTLVVDGPRGGFLSIDANAADPTKPASRNGDGWYHGRERGHVDDHAVYEFIDPAAFP